MKAPSLLDSIRVVKENERIASESYLTASNEITNPIGKQIFLELSSFEKYHFEKLSGLEKSLEESGEYIEYEKREFLLPPIFEIKASENPQNKSVITILTQAIELEIQAETVYTDLAAQVSDPLGHKMFSRLAEEEHQHYRILREAYWTVTNLGTWKWVAL
ncbi:MAG TPA: ferritin family protein [Anaerolineaceae bacterium]|nr:ferritin family protein [Anaerolineaceae bacterium]